MLINIPDNTTVCALMKFADSIGCQIRVVDGVLTLSVSQEAQKSNEFFFVWGPHDTNTNKPR